MPNTNDSEAVRQARVRQLWEARPVEEYPATETGILSFYHWLEGHHPELLPLGSGDPYQRLRGELRDTYRFQTDRLRNLLAERAPGKEISFDDSRTTVRFRIIDPVTDTELVEPTGEWFPVELADKSDDALWEMIRHLSNGKL